MLRGDVALEAERYGRPVADVRADREAEQAIGMGDCIIDRDAAARG